MDRKEWIFFVEINVVNFFIEFEAEKLTIEDGVGNKAKLKRLRDDSIKIEHTTKVIV